ncbi:MAG: cadmium-translocating P-type ATPase, partial [Clostridiales bacterium]|nr:cadmium-translocating P-type ATPase [Clostridiales bacterium]
MLVRNGSTIFRIICAVVLAIVASRFDFGYNISLWIYVVAYLIAGVNVVKKSLFDILKGEFFDENFLMLVATIGAFVTQQYMEAILVMIIYEIGEILQDEAVDDSKKAIKDLIDQRPRYVSVQNDGMVTKAKPENVTLGEVIVVAAGESISLDGVIVKGHGNIDFSSLTGESVPKYLKEGDMVYSGGISKDGTIFVKVTKTYSESTMSKMLKFIEDADNQKSKTERFMTKFSKRYTPVVMGMAFLFVMLAKYIPFMERVKRACMFLVIACPCALVLSLPLCFFYGMGLCSKCGVLVKGGVFIEMLSNIGRIMFDKTGTLTRGEFEVVSVNALVKQDVLKIAAHCEASSNHPVAGAIKRAYGEDIDYEVLSDSREIAGRGTSCLFEGKTVFVGSSRFMEENNILVPDEVKGVGAIYVAYDGEYVGNIIVADEIKKEAKDMIQDLKRGNIKVSMITGDNKDVAISVANELEIEDVAYEVFPEDKASIVKERMQSESVAF